MNPCLELHKNFAEPFDGVPLVKVGDGGDVVSLDDVADVSSWCRGIQAFDNHSPRGRR